MFVCPAQELRISEGGGFTFPATGAIIDSTNHDRRGSHGTGEPSAEKLAEEMRQDYNGGKKNFLQKILDYLKPAGEIIGTTEFLAL